MIKNNENLFFFFLEDRLLEHRIVFRTARKKKPFQAAFAGQRKARPAWGRQCNV